MDGNSVTLDDIGNEKVLSDYFRNVHVVGEGFDGVRFTQDTRQTIHRQLRMRLVYIQGI